jgi:DNA-binding MarR family transcriptional regulator
MSSVPTPTPPSDVAHACAADDVAIDADLGWALGVVFRSYLKIAHKTMCEVPGGPRGYQVLAAAFHGRQNTQLALANQLGIDRTVMTYLIDDIERAGLVERQPDPADRRARRVVVTPEGHELVARLQERLKLAEDHVLAALDEGEQAVFRTLLRRLATRADAADPAKSACDVVDEVAKITGTEPR